MKFSVRRALCVIVVAAMLLCTLPAAMAADTTAQDGMSVLRTLTRSDLVTKTVSVSSPEDPITLTVPYSYADRAIKLSSGTDFTANAGFSDISLEFSGPASIDGSAVDLTVSYTVDGDESGATYRTVYVVNAVRADSVPAVFEGVITKTVNAGGSVSLPSSEFSLFYTQNDGKPLAGVKIAGTNPSWGMLKLGNAEYDGKILTVAELNNLSFSASGSGTVMYRVHAYDDVRNGSPIGEVTLKVTSETIAPTTSVINYTVREGESVSFRAVDFSAAMNDLPAGVTLTRVRFTVPPALGTLMISGEEVQKTNDYYVNANDGPSISNVLYKSTGGYGNDTVNYSAYLSDGTQLAGTIKMTVSSKDPDVITYSVEAGEAIVFNAADFTNVMKKYDSVSSFHHVIITAPSATYGVLYKNYVSATNPGTRVTAGTDTGNLYTSGSAATQIGRVAFVPTASLSAQDITLYYAAYDTSSHVLYNGEIIVKVKTQGSTGTVKYSCTKNGSVKFSASDFRYRASSSSGWLTPTYIVINEIPRSTQGYIYCAKSTSNETQLAAKDEGSTRYYYSATSTNNIANLSFSARSGFTGDISIPFTAYESNGNVMYEGNIVITVTGSSNTGSAEDISYELNSDDYVTFKVTDFNNACIDATGNNLNYVTFALPATSRGRLYLNYSTTTSTGTAVSASTKYYRTSTPKIGSISFVPNENYNGTFTLSYTGYSSSGDSYTGYVEITVNESDSSVITYTVVNGNTVTFRRADFNSLCKNETGSTLDHIRFDSLSTSYGRLYYNYSTSSTRNPVAAKTNYYYAGSDDLIANITFVPNTKTSATVTYKFTGYDTDNDSFEGEIKIKITGSSTATDEENDIITYNLRNDSSVKLNASDFNSMSRSITGDILDYVRFSPPSSTYGQLYVNYNSASSLGTIVNSSTNYYRSGSTPLISDITFVPNSSYTGTFNISFTGYDVEGVRFSGTMRITVTQGSGNTNTNTETNTDTTKTATRISYKTDVGTPVSFAVNDFNTACYGATGKTLSYINFSIPNAAAGKLYTDYNSQTASGTSVTAGTNYYFNTSPNISTVSFVPEAGFNGSATISYTGYATDGTSFAGSVVITVGENSGGGSAHFDDVGSSLSWAVQGVDYLYEKGIVTGTAERTYSPMNNIKRGDFILMLQRAFRFEASGNTKQFADVSPSSYYAAAILAAKSNEIALGGGNNLFDPEASLTREDAMVLVVRVLEKAGESPKKGSASDIASFVDRGDVSGYAVEAVATLVRAGYILGSDGKLNPKSNITRAEMAVLLYRIITK